MKKLDTNALLFSNRNIELAYTLKKICREIGIHVTNCDSTTSLIMHQIQIHPQVMIFDLTQNSLCDLDFVKAFCEKGFYFVPNIIIISDEIINIDFPTQSGLFIFKNSNLECQLHNVINNIRLNIIKNKVQRYSESLINEGIIECLKLLCFNKKHKGYKYLKDCVSMTIVNDGICNNLTNVVYPAVAAINYTTLPSIERDIRTCIKAMWRDSKAENLYGFFGEIKVKKYPSNQLVIYSITEKVLSYCLAKSQRNQNIA